MYKLLIVDDEPLVQIGLQSMLNWQEHKIEICGSAANGAEALRMIEEHHPELVIANIKMPIMTGLELLKLSGEKFGEIPVFIMLTSYEEFQMVKEALRMQAVDYLLKLELNKADLLAAVQKAVRRVDESLSRQSAPNDRITETQTLSSFQEKFLIRLLNGLLREEAKILKEGAKLQLDFHYRRYLCAHAHIHGADSNLPLNSSCQKMIREIIRKYSDCYSLSNDPSHYTLIFYFEEELAVAEKMAGIQQGLDNCIEMIRGYFNVLVSFGLGTTVCSASDIPISFEEAKAAEQESSENQPLRLFSHIVGARRRSGKDKLIASIRSYIDENLGGKLQLNEVAEVFGLSPNYLSVLFRKSCELGFSEYVNTKKIEKARQLLLSGDMRIYEVADALGFESAFYFSKVFKKIDGHSPREYIQRKTEG